MRTSAVAALVVVLGAAVAGCGRKETVVILAPGAGPGTGTAAAATLPAGLLLAAAPAGAKDVKEVKRAAKEGETVVLRGRVAGGGSPFVAGRAAMTVADPSFPACSEREGDGCPSPWDLCCESAEDLAAGTATVEVADAEGRVLKAGLEGFGGLKPLSTVIVTGVVGARPDPKVLVIRATGIFRER